MDILLGIYQSSSFKRQLNSERLTYPFVELLDWDKLDCWSVISVVKAACKACNCIYFVLDEIQFPLQTKFSFTCAELNFVLSNEDIFDKTIFILNNEYIDTEQFNEWYKLNRK